MLNIDDKDKKILYELEKDSRQTKSKIGKKLGIHENVVAYRIKNLEKKGIIQYYYTFIDTIKLGFISLRFYFRLQFVTPKITEQIIEYFLKNRFVWCIGSMEGKYHIVINILVKNLNDFSNFWDEVLDKYLIYFEDRVFSQLIRINQYDYLYLLKNTKILNRDEIVTINNGKIVKIDDIDGQILKKIAGNARKPIKEIANELNFTQSGIKYRLKRLEEKKIILGYKTKIDISKVGYSDFKLDLNLRNYNKRSDIINFVKNNPNLILINKSSGISDIELEFHVENLEKLITILEQIRNKFPDSIKNYNYYRIIKRYKWKIMPGG